MMDGFLFLGSKVDKCGERERDGERWREMERDGERWREMERETEIEKTKSKHDTCIYRSSSTCPTNWSSAV